MPCRNSSGVLTRDEPVRVYRHIVGTNQKTKIFVIILSELDILMQAAAEAEAATMSMVRRAIPDASSLDEANEIVRGNWLNAIEQHHQRFSGNTMIRNILDIGCSVGVSSRYLANKFPSAKVTVSAEFSLWRSHKIKVSL